MTVIAIKAFRGAVPRMSSRLLQPNQAIRAWNCRITSGRLDPVNKPRTVVTSTIANNIRSIYRYRHLRAGVRLDSWLTWDSDVDMAPSPLANEERGTFYFTSEAFDPRVSNYELAISGSVYPNAWFALGVPSPTVAPTVTPTGGSGTDEERSYAYTFVTAWGEESGPSPASALATGKPDGTWALTNLQTAPPNSGTVVTALANTPASGQVRIELNSVFGLAQHERITIAGVVGMTDLNGSHRILSVDAANNRVVVALETAQTYTSGGTWAREALLNTTGMVKRIYRTAGNDSAFLFVAEIPASTTSYNDTVAGADLGEVIITAGTLPPPKNLTCFDVLPNGCGVGLAGNEVCFSDPYMLYSWPLSNRYSFSGRGVALVKAGNSVIVLTEGQPILFTGSDPEAMSPTTIETYAPCVSKRGMVDVGGGALYPSHDGLWLITPQGAKKITQGLYREDEWKALNPHTFQAALFDGQYHAHYAPSTGEPKILVLDINEPDSVTEITEDVGAIYRNDFDGMLYVAKGKTIRLWEGDGANFYLSDWLSRDHQLATPTTLNCAQIFADFGAIVAPDTSQQEANAALHATPMMGSGQIAGTEVLRTQVAGSLLTPSPPVSTRSVQMTLLRNGVPWFTKTVTSSKPFRLPTGYRDEVFSVQIAASVKTYSIALASSMEELKQVAP